MQFKPTENAPTGECEQSGPSPSKRAVGHTWEPIKPLTEAEAQYDFGFPDAWRERWDQFRARPDVQQRLLGGIQRLERLWSIETGVIEGLYTIHRGTATTLLEHGFVQNVIRDEHTDIDPDLLLSILKDHEASVELVHGYIRDGRPLSPYAIRELHACITAHQDTHLAVDSLGQRVHRPLLKGEFKVWPNNPTRPDGKIHPYAPPEQVDSEIAALVEQYEVYSDSAHPILCAAWLHHRFVQIHPFADGNGRTGRALMNWHLIKQDCLPIAVTSHNRRSYIHALERADRGNLSQFVDFLCHLTRGMVRVVVGNGEESKAILGPPFPPEEMTMGDYPGLRK